MAKKNKFYVVWEGFETGIFDNWQAAEAQIKGYAGAKYKSFERLDLAEAAFKKSYWASVSTQSKNKPSPKPGSGPLTPSLSVDAACAGNPGALEYQGVDTATKQLVFKQGPFPEGTVNLGEFLALVHGLAYLKQHQLPYPIYSDSITAISWVRKKAIKTNLQRNAVNEALFQRVDRALEWLHANTYATQILKWETEVWGENPADYGRK